MEESQMIEGQRALENVKGFLSANVIPAKEGRKCIDGRYNLATEDSGMIARPGADFGYVEVLAALNTTLGLGLTAEQCFDKVYDVVTANGGTFYMHTDHHADPEHEGDHHDKPILGCGHIAKAANPTLAAMYGVDPEIMKQLVAYVRRRINEGARIRMVNLEGGHGEEGVLINKGIQRTVNSFNRSQYFVYDKTRDDNYMKERLVPSLAIEGIAYEAFQKVSDMQLNATLQNLAKGMGTYVFNADDPLFDVSFAGNV